MTPNRERMVSGYPLRQRAAPILLNDAGADALVLIDYGSRDTEGSDVDIVSGFEWASREISLITVEHNFLTPP